MERNITPEQGHAEVMGILCPECHKKVEQMIPAGETIFSRDEKEYGFCGNCLKKVTEWVRGVDASLVPNNA